MLASKSPSFTRPSGFTAVASMSHISACNVRPFCAALTRIWHPQMVEVYAKEDLGQTSDRICALLIQGLR